MQTIGLVGGMSWHSTVEYYRVFNELVAERRGGHASAKVALQSLDFAEIRECQVNDDWDRAAQLLAENMVSLPLDPLPNILLWNDTIVGNVSDNPILGPFWNLNEWGLAA